MNGLNNEEKSSFCDLFDIRRRRGKADAVYSESILAAGNLNRFWLFVILFEHAKNKIEAIFGITRQIF